MLVINGTAIKSNIPSNIKIASNSINVNPLDFFLNIFIENTLSILSARYDSYPSFYTTINILTFKGKVCNININHIQLF
ncbi:hypothetical protein SDC9_163543 [bioreactor metagenome]|uniref:Uncharacterized protein n=1 Tax=bioreactor metagenome TaxID=1076179 RepID=A0A645FP45_9ZZZZ